MDYNIKKINCQEKNKIQHNSSAEFYLTPIRWIVYVGANCVRPPELWFWYLVVRKNSGKTKRANTVRPYNRICVNQWFFIQKTNIESEL